MQFKFSFYLSIFGLIVFGSGCLNSPKEKPAAVSPRIKKNIKILSPDTKKDYYFGDTLSISLTGNDDTRVDSFQVNFHGEVVNFIGHSGNLLIKKVKVGASNLQIIAATQEGKETLHTVIKVYNNDLPKEYFVKIINKFNHDPKAYTQGLFFLDKDTLVESTGQYSKSTIRKVNPLSGKIYSEKSLPDDYFGEGTTLWKNKIIQLTWTNSILLVYNQNLELKQTFPLRTEGWGLATYFDDLLLSDGSEKIYHISPEDFTEKNVTSIYIQTEKVNNLNELEWHDGILYANIYGKDQIALIDIQSGSVIGLVDCSLLIDREKYKGLDYALNGIAVHPQTKNLWVTGKWWPFIYEIELKLKEPKI